MTATRRAPGSGMDTFHSAAGRHTCIEVSFAWMEGILRRPALSQRGSVGLPAGHALDSVRRLTLRPRGGMPIGLTRRERIAVVGTASV